MVGEAKTRSWRRVATSKTISGHALDKDPLISASAAPGPASSKAAQQLPVEINSNSPSSTTIPALRR